MTPEALARLAARAYVHMHPWSAAQFAASLAAPHSLLVTRQGAFVLGQVIAGEAEILALACDPDHQGTGLASRTLLDFVAQSRARGATRLILEVSENNHPARRFYDRHGLAQVGRRRAYYRDPQGGHADALVMARDLP